MPIISYPADCKAIIDVTKAPYSLDPTGKQDCTAALIRILDDLARHSIEGVAKVIRLLEADPDPKAKLPNSFENCKRNGKIFAIFPYEKPPSRIIYFPKGTYLVSDTVCYTLDKLQNGFGSELNWHIRFQGESREESIIKLKDSCPGYGVGANKPVISFMRGNYSNVSMSNFFRNLTIDIGSGNPGANGLDFYGSNSAAVRHVTIRSSDPEGKGAAGLTISREHATGCSFSHVEVQGFDYGVRFQTDGSYLVCEHIVLKNQRQRGMFIDGPVVTIRKLQSDNAQPAMTIRGHHTHVVLLDSELRGRLDETPAIEHLTGQLFLRNITAPGYRCVLGMTYAPGWGTEPVVDAPQVAEYVYGTTCTLAPDQEKRSLNIPIEDEPTVAWDLNFSNWTNPSVYGAVGDGVTDDTVAIQRAMDSGKSVVYFQPGRYRINAPIRIPASVQRLNFMFVDLVAGDAMRDMRGKGMFTIVGQSAQPLIFEDLFSFEMNYGHHFLVDHASTRILVMRDIHSQACSSYFNSVPGGTVFMDGIVTTNGVLSDTYARPCFVFTGQKVWCRQLDPEYSPNKIINDGGQVVVMGIKTEGHGVALTTRNGGRTELLGGILLFGGNNGVPMVLNDNSDVAFIASTTGSYSHHLFDVAVREVQQGGQSREARHDLFPIRFRKQYAVPLYVGRLARVG